MGGKELLRFQAKTPAGGSLVGRAKQPPAPKTRWGLHPNQPWGQGRAGRKGRGCPAPVMPPCVFVPFLLHISAVWWESGNSVSSAVRG